MDIERLRKRVAFERYLARLFTQDPAPWVLKGGYALEIRLGGRARSTKDIDLNVPPPPMEDLLDELQEAAELNLDDFFVFPRRPTEEAAGRGAPGRMALRSRGLSGGPALHQLPTGRGPGRRAARGGRVA